MKVLQLTKNGEAVATHASLAAAARAVDGSASNVSNACRGKLKSAYGFVWKFEAVEDRGEVEWRPVGRCFVSADGRLKRPAGGGFEIIGTADMGVSNGYPTVTIDGTTWPFHRLVASAFLDLRPEATVRFLDGDRTNAAVSNLAVGGAKRAAEVPALDVSDDYLAGLFDGDGSVVMSLVGSAACKSVQLKTELTQCDAGFLRRLAAKLDAGTVYVDGRTAKYKNEPAATWRIVGAYAKPLLEIVARRAVVKAEQAALALRFLDLPRGARDAKETARLRMRDLNSDKTAYPKDFSRVTDDYVAGLFDAEGCVYDGVKKYVKITQKSDPRLLDAVASHLGMGRVCPDDHAWKIYSRHEFAAFRDRVGARCVLKRAALDRLMDGRVDG